MAEPFTATSDGVRVRVRVTPKSGRSGIEGFSTTANGAAALKVRVTAAPDKGKANEALIALLATEWRMPKTRLSLVAGAGSRAKVVLIRGDPDELMRRLRAWAKGRT